MTRSWGLAIAPQVHFYGPELSKPFTTKQFVNLLGLQYHEFFSQMYEVSSAGIMNVSSI